MELINIALDYSNHGLTLYYKKKTYYLKPNSTHQIYDNIRFIYSTCQCFLYNHYPLHSQIHYDVSVNDNSSKQIILNIQEDNNNIITTTQHIFLIFTKNNSYRIDVF
jgi:hypothetical protein